MNIITITIYSVALFLASTALMDLLPGLIPARKATQPVPIRIVRRK